MMFNYFRPGGVKDDLPPGCCRAVARRTSRRSRHRSTDTRRCSRPTRSSATAPAASECISPRPSSTTGVTGPMARASGVDIDLRRDEPYAAYADFDVRVPLGKVGDSFDRYTVRIAEMRESARLALLALEGMPEGDFVAPGVPRALKPPAGVRVPTRREPPRRTRRVRGERRQRTALAPEDPLAGLLQPPRRACRAARSPDRRRHRDRGFGRRRHGGDRPMTPPQTACSASS